MFPSWRLKLREAKVAFEQGRLDDAEALLREEHLDDFLPGKKLSAKLALRIIDRARERVMAGQTAAGWGDLVKASQLGGAQQAIDHLRGELMNRGIGEAVGYMLAGDPHAAVTRLARLEHHQPLSAEGRRLKDIAEQADRSKQLADRGHFAEAVEQLDMAIALAGAGDTLELKKALGKRRDEILPHIDRIRDLSDRLYQAVEATHWQEVLQMAEAILIIAPKCTTAQGARRRAWRAIGMDVTQVHSRRPETYGHPASNRCQRGQFSTRPGASDAKGDTVTEHQCGERFLLWIDAVGGFLVCMGEEIFLGQPSSRTAIDLPILADLSRHHATIRRDGGSYVFEPRYASRIDERSVNDPVILADGQVITLGGTVRMRFRKPHVLSATARLSMETHHKTQPSADGVILLADSCVLGPKSHSHISCRDWKQDVVLYRQDDRLFCRASGPFQIDGVDVEGGGQIGPGSRVEGAEFSFSLEAIK
ncbi:MAG: FHA domain-containing protein [Pirellulales bacterium]|nr:FHA domain-containing protein [Pirellulales bacterium]